MKAKKVTIRDIAERCGVSIATVSRAINGTAGVRPEIKAQIFQCMEDCGWRSNNLESRLSLPASDRSVVILTTRREPLSEYSITTRLIDRFREEGYLPLLLVGGTSTALEFCLQSRPFAVIFYGNPSLFREQIGALERIGICWSPNDEDAWNRQFAAAEKYYKSHGDLNIPKDFISEDGKRLGQWLIVQRRKYKQGALSDERIARLQSIGIRWEGSRGRHPHDGKSPQAARG